MDRQGQGVDDGDPGYGIGAVARRLGVPAPTLRTWNLRYGIGPSRRSPGGHRRYDTDDLHRLEEMNRLIRSGVPAADAAREVLRIGAAPPGPAAAEAPPAPEPVPEPLPGVPAPGPVPGVPAPEPVPGVPGRPAPEAVRYRPPLPSAAAREKLPPAAPRPRPEIPTAAMLARAAVALDSQTVSGWIDVALSRNGVMWTWEHLVMPVFETICRRQAETGASVEVEHLFSDRVLAALTRLIEHPSWPINDRPVLLACAEEEQHSLPLYALAAVLGRDYHVETRVLGARTPYGALRDAMHRLGPSVVFVWSQLRETGDPAPLTSLPRLRPPSRVVVGGRGWWDDLPPEIPRVTSFAEALTRIVSSVR
ncbi:MerR family transcriptional regulator [Streptosporangium sp. NPDC051022]|uniref:MerR family transcriptional regulator n=1 Tax=Streptosporangium sp. NPDC051022 TaxID=3155752 RepID=UPI0034192D8A